MASTYYICSSDKVTFVFEICESFATLSFEQIKYVLAACPFLPLDLVHSEGDSDTAQTVVFELSEHSLTSSLDQIKYV